LAFSLLADVWIPVRRASGGLATIRPQDITDDIDGDPVVALDWPRPDFRLAGLEFLIGLLATACPPEDTDAWLAGWETPPAPDALAAAFAPLEQAFVLDGEGPRFMQDLEDFAGEANRIETLLIDAPGGQTLKKNADHFVKRAAVVTMGRAAAAMALFTLQSFAPAGGAGNRVGLRGGGPLTTLAIPPSAKSQPLWHLLWANVPAGEAPTAAQLPAVFPWLAPTRTSEGARTTSPPDVHDLQGFWGMPRRIRLEFADNDGSVCDLDGGVDTVVVRGWRQRPYGTNYAAWRHHLSPYYRQKPSDPEWLPVHGQPGGVGYRHWVGLLFDDADAPMRRPAAAITAFRDRLKLIARGDQRIRWRMLAAGYDIYNNMKVRDFIESEMPVIEPGDPARITEFILTVRGLIEAATEAASLVGRCVRQALFSDGAKVALDAAVFATLRARFWDATEADFLRHAQAAAGGECDGDTVRRDWLRDLSRAARTLFAEAAPIDASGADRRPDRIAAAARRLDLALKGYGKDGEALFKALKLAPPERKPKPPKGRQAA
jgi:CRISPR system Cascade subunit CasA